MEASDDICEKAIKNLKAKQAFRTQLLTFLAVSVFLIVIWALTDSEFFWPIFPIVGWGIGVVLNAWDVYRNDEFADEDIRREMEHLQR